MIGFQKHPGLLELLPDLAFTPSSITTALRELWNRGYRSKFRRDANCLYCIDLDAWFLSDDFTVDEGYHFNGSTSAQGESMLYAISSSQGLKGFIVDTYYTYADSDSEYELLENY